MQLSIEGGRDLARRSVVEKLRLFHVLGLGGEKAGNAASLDAFKSTADVPSTFRRPQGNE